MPSSPYRFLCPARTKGAPSPLTFRKPSHLHPLFGTQFSVPLRLANVTSVLNSKPEINLNLFCFRLVLPQKFSEDAGPINEFREFRFFLGC